MTDSVPLTVEQMVASLSTRFERVEQAILGDPSIGHIGLVDRMARVEQDHRDVPLTHQAMEDRRIEGDKRAHDHIEKIEDHLEDKILHVGSTSAADTARIEKKIDKLIWIVIGAAAVITGGGSWAFLAG